MKEKRIILFKIIASSIVQMQMILQVQDMTEAKDDEPLSASIMHLKNRSKKIGSIVGFKMLLSMPSKQVLRSIFIHLENSCKRLRQDSCGVTV